MFSVIIPTYNRKEFIAASIYSVLDQGYDTEIIVVDDRSKDGTEKVVEKLQKLHPNILYVVNDGPKGPSGARNVGIRRSSREFIAFLDSDDVWLPGYLSLAIDVFAGHDDIDVVFSNFIIKDHKTNEVISEFFSEKPYLSSLKGVAVNDSIFKLQDDLFSALVRENFFSLCGAIIRRRVLDGLFLSEKLSFAEDRDLAIRLAMERGALFAYRIKPSFIAYRHGSNICSGNTDVKSSINSNSSKLKLFMFYLNKYMLTVKQKESVRYAMLEINKNLMWEYRYTLDIPSFCITIMRYLKLTLIGCFLGTMKWLRI